MVPGMFEKFRKNPFCGFWEIIVRKIGDDGDNNNDDRNEKNNKSPTPRGRWLNNKNAVN